jgi:hypothetical protein
VAFAKQQVRDSVEPIPRIFVQQQIKVGLDNAVPISQRKQQALRIEPLKLSSVSAPRSPKSRKEPSPRLRISTRAAPDVLNSRGVKTAGPATLKRAGEELLRAITRQPWIAGISRQLQPGRRGEADTRPGSL